MSLAFNLVVAPAFESRKDIFLVSRFPTITGKSSLTVKCSLAIPLANMDLKGKIKEKFNGNSPAAAMIHPADIPSNLCLIDSFERLGIDRYFRSEIDTILEDTYKLWQLKEKCIFSDMTTHAMAFRLLRVKGYEVSSEELAPYADEERVKLQTTDVAAVVELYRAAQERIYEEETTLEKILAWTSTFLKQQLLTNSIPNKKLHKNVEYYLKNYHGILDRMGVRRTLDLYDIGYYQALKHEDSLCNEELLAFTRQDFNKCQAQHQKELEQLQRWYANCRLDTKHRREAVSAANFVASAMIGDPELSDVRLAFAKQMVLIPCIDDLLDQAGSREESNEILELVKEWKEKPAGEYGSEEVEILFTALYNTVNELAEMAGIHQGPSVKDFLIQLWVEQLSAFKLELDIWSDETAVSLDDYLSSLWVSIGSKLCILTSMQFIGVKLSQEKLMSEECNDLCMHVSMINRILNDVGSFEREKKENKVNSVSLLVGSDKDGRGKITEEEAIAKLREMAEYHRRKLMQIVYKKGTIFPRECKDLFLKVCRAGCYLYSSGDEFTSPRKMMEDVKSLVYEPLTLHSLT